MSDSHSPLLLQAISISKAINTQEAPVKEKHARRILFLCSQDSTEEFGVWGCHPLVLEPQRFGRQRSRQSLVGGWHHTGSAMREKANEQGNKIAFVWQ